MKKENICQDCKYFTRYEIPLELTKRVYPRFSKNINKYGRCEKLTRDQRHIKSANNLSSIYINEYEVGENFGCIRFVGITASEKKLRYCKTVKLSNKLYKEMKTLLNEITFSDKNKNYSEKLIKIIKKSHKK